MNISLFNRKYVVRRFGQQSEIQGFLHSNHKDIECSLHVHPATDSVRSESEGQRHLVYLQGHGNVPLVTADESTGRKADLLRYQGRWYECTSSEYWEHTLLSHYNYKFTLVPIDRSNIADLQYNELECGCGEKL